MIKNNKVTTHKQIIELWPSIGSVCADLDEKFSTVKQWKYRNSIPSDRWVKIVEAARERDIALTYTMLAEAASR